MTHVSEPQLVELVFCVTALDAAGETQAAKKRTAVTTNSLNPAEVLKQAQCKGLRKH